MDTLETPVTAPTRVTWYEADASPAKRSPRSRPPVGLRVVLGLLGFASVLSAGALLLSDRAPGVLATVFGDRARRLWARIDATERIDLPPTSEIPPTDFVAHVMIWLVVTALVALAIWTWRGLAGSVVVLSALGLGLELAQGRYATMRTVQAADAAANVVGVLLGALAAAVCFIGWSAATALARALRRPRALPRT